MKKQLSIYALAAVAAASFAMPTTLSAQEAEAAPAPAESESLWSFSAGADLVSSHIWRGLYGAGASFEPSIGVSCGPVTLSAWGTCDFSATNKEVDLMLSFEKGGFSAIFTDYYYPDGGKFFEYDEEATCHQLELGVAYDFGATTNVPLSIAWNTMIGGDDLNEEGDRMFSSYFELGYSFKVKDFDIALAAGFTPYESCYQETDGFNMTNFSVKGSYEICFTDKFHLPVFAQFVLNPNKEDAHMVFGFTF